LKRTAIITPLVFLGLFMVLGFQQCEQQRALAPRPVDYLIGWEAPAGEDPLHIVSDGLALAGVSADGRIVGYTTEESPAYAAMAVDQALRAQGWAPIDGNGQGIVGFTRSSAAAQGQATYALLMFTQISSGTSVVAELM
jgi:hypothetical protein